MYIALKCLYSLCDIQKLYNLYKYHLAVVIGVAGEEHAHESNHKLVVNMCGSRMPPLLWVLQH